MRNFKQQIGHVESNLRQAERFKDELDHERALPKTTKSIMGYAFLLIRELFLSLHYCLKTSDENFKDIEARLQKLEKEGG